MKLISTGIFVTDQEKALNFYTSVLGFVIKADVPVGEFRWISLVSKGDEKGTELTLEPNNHPAAKAYQEALHRDGIPANMFGVDNIEASYQELVEKGVKFVSKPTAYDGYTIAVFDDTVGNLIQIIEMTK